MNIKTRHGYETPISSDLEDYQLGWSIEDGCLYIKDPNSSEDNKVLRVVSDKSLLESKFAEAMKEKLNTYSDEEIAKAKEELKKLYEKKTTYVIEFGLPLDDEKDSSVDYTKDTEFEYYTKESADEAVAAFISNLSVVNEGVALIGSQDPTISNAGSKIIISKADHSVAYLYMILEKEDGSEYGQLINTLEQSFPSLCLEWSEKAENTLEFKLNEEVLNSIDFSEMVIDEGEWEHTTGHLDLGKLIPGMKEYDYIHPISPICVRAVKNCEIKPTSTTSYSDTAYGYSSNPTTKMATFTSSNHGLSYNSEGTTPWNTGSQPITQKISDAVTRGKYYSVFRVKSGYDDGTPSYECTTSVNGSTYNYNALPTIGNRHRGLVEAYNPNAKRWEFFVPYDTYEIYSSVANTAGKGCAYPTSCWTAPTSTKPIMLNNGDSSNILSSNMPYFYCNLRRGWFTNTANRSAFYNLTSDLNSAVYYATNNSINARTYITMDSNPFYSTLYKIPINEYVPIEEGYDYTFLEALDYYSRAYWVPQYMDYTRTTVHQQLVDIFQIMLKNANAVRCTYEAAGTNVWTAKASSGLKPVLPLNITYDQNYGYYYSNSYIYLSTTQSHSYCKSYTGVIYSSTSSDSYVNSHNSPIQPGTSFKDRTATVFTNNDISNFISSDTDTYYSKCFVNSAVIPSHISLSNASTNTAYKTANRFCLSVNSGGTNYNDFSYSMYLPCQYGYGNYIATNVYGQAWPSALFNTPFKYNGGHRSMVSFSEIYGFAKGLDGFAIKDLS